MKNRSLLPARIVLVLDCVPLAFWVVSQVHVPLADAPAGSASSNQMVSGAIVGASAVQVVHGLTVRLAVVVVP
jgi:hypothetical protein